MREHAAPCHDLRNREVTRMQAQTPNAPGLRTFSRAYLGFPDQLRQVRAALARILDGCPVAEDAVLLASEIASSAILFSNSGKKGGQFTVRAELHPGDYVWIEVEDQGGPWEEHDRSESHGLRVVARIAGDGNWGIEGSVNGRVAWFRLDWNAT